jgi:hypothetical protein
MTDLTTIQGDAWAAGRIELQACAASQPALIATMPCESIEQAEAAADLMLSNPGLDLIMLRIVRDGRVADARHFIGDRAWAS